MLTSPLGGGFNLQFFDFIGWHLTHDAQDIYEHINAKIKVIS